MKRKRVFDPKKYAKYILAGDSDNAKTVVDLLYSAYGGVAVALILSEISRVRAGVK